MLEFKELSIDGTDLERLVREIFVREGFETHWTGKGADGGRDLLVKEQVKGPLSNFERLWLVQCKHKAHSGKAVGKDEANSLITDCRRVGATGYLMICTTALTSGLIQAYKELENTEDNLVIDYWDEVRLEDKLLKPCNFSLIDQFFPNSSNQVGWKIYNTDSPSFWAANYKRAFLYLSSRLAMNFSTSSYIAKIYDYIQEFSRKNELDMESIDLQLRGIYYDDKYTAYMAFIDCIVDKHIAPDDPFELSEIKKDIKAIENELPDFIDVKGGYITLNWDVKVYFENKYSDAYSPHAKEFYMPYMNNFKSGFRRK
ncbi:restriction endonuclease [Bacillus cereus]|nr:restriction endonuclease [Bacillus cereus]